ncbi:Tetratricopeptide repeat protein [Sulfidibacter corallicola]|uniref:Tetratricopeptide repeat protein n=1 Tax=Sulfidibacter corallicola TaxID=2818388 RepID=A0A8A4TVY9_SULCO|nr:tetratricopeptide repeat protein [Sulfidibacter corallicola]QTD53331.1 tetratricopeptide repeat protein [Sulfidibacter corallicola]
MNQENPTAERVAEPNQASLSPELKAALTHMNEQWQEQFNQLSERLMRSLSQQVSQAIARMESSLAKSGGDPLRTRPVDDESSGADAAQLNDYGVQLYYCNELGQAMHILEEASNKNPQSAEIWNNLAVVYTALGQTEKSIVAFQKATQINPHQVDVLNNRGVLALLEATPESALELLEQAGDINPQSIPVLLNLAQAHQALGQIDKAIQLWKRVKAIDPANDEATQFLRQYYQDE